MSQICKYLALCNVGYISVRESSYVALRVRNHRPVTADLILKGRLPVVTKYLNFSACVDCESISECGSLKFANLIKWHIRLLGLHGDCPWPGYVKSVTNQKETGSTECLRGQTYW